MEELLVFFSLEPQDSKTPFEFNRNRQIKGVYLYILSILRTPSNWEMIAKEFCKEELDLTFTGKGSTRAACKKIQEHWGSFVIWLRKKR